MKKETLLAIAVFAVTALLLILGAVFPIPSAAAYAGGSKQEDAKAEQTASGPEGAVQALGTDFKLRAFGKAYNSLANKAQFSQDEFMHDVTGYGLSLRTYATLNSFEVQPLHETATEADMAMKLEWSTVVGTFTSTRNLHLVKNGNTWAVDWPLVPAKHVPPQVIPVNYLRWDVIRSGAGDDWGTQDVEAPHVRIVDMHPVNRADGVVVMGELLNEDIVPAYVSVRATLLGKDGSIIDKEESFDMILHTLLPKQVTPFIIQFPGVDLSQVASIKMEPLAQLVSASADPVIEVQNQKFTAVPDAMLTGQLENQSGQSVNVAHLLSTFYDSNGQVVWVAGQYIDRELLPQTPVDFQVSIPADLAKKVTSERTVVATYQSGAAQ
jgi:hypothetical protein